MPQLCSAWTSVTLMPSNSCVPPLLPPSTFSTPLLPSQVAVSKIAWTAGLVALAISTASWMWSKWPWVMSIRSQLSTFFRWSGATGLFITQGSIRISLPRALRARHVPCPIQVNLTWSLSAMHFTSNRFVARAQKTMVPYAHAEHGQAAQRPQVGQGRLAGRPDEAEAGEAEQGEHAPPPVLD